MYDLSTFILLSSASARCLSFDKPRCCRAVHFSSQTYHCKACHPNITWFQKRRHFIALFNDRFGNKYLNVSNSNEITQRWWDIHVYCCLIRKEAEHICRSLVFDEAGDDEKYLKVMEKYHEHFVSKKYYKNVHDWGKKRGFRNIYQSTTWTSRALWFL